MFRMIGGILMLVGVCRGITAHDMLANWEWLISLGFIVVGALLSLVGVFVDGSWTIEGGSDSRDDD